MAIRHPSSAENPAGCCSQEHRIEKLEAKIESHESTLTDGKIEFASIKKDLAQILLSQSEIKLVLSKPLQEPTRLDKFWDAMVNWAAGAILVGGLWVLAKSGQIPGIHS